MRFFGVLGALLVLSACTSPLPQPDPQQAWIDLSVTAGEVLTASRLDNVRMNDGRYFQVSPGKHALEVRYRFETPRGGDLYSSNGQLMTCILRVRYDDFVAGQRYVLEARPLQVKAQAWLYDEQRNVLARGEVLRCGSY